MTEAGERDGNLLASFQACCDAMSDEALALAIDELFASRPRLQQKMARKGVSTEVSLPEPTYAAEMGALREVPPGEVVKVFEVSEMPLGKSIYAFLISAVIPRPIALVSTILNDGVVNLAPFSFCGDMSHDPPTLVFCPIYRQGKPKGHAGQLYG